MNFLPDYIKAYDIEPNLIVKRINNKNKTDNHEHLLIAIKEKLYKVTLMAKHFFEKVFKTVKDQQ